MTKFNLYAGFIRPNLANPAFWAPLVAIVVLTAPQAAVSQVSFNPASVSEGAGAVTLSVNLLAPADRDTTVWLDFSASTATLGTDFQVSVDGKPSVYSLFIAAGERSAEATISIVDDAIIDRGEVVSVLAKYDLRLFGRTQWITIGTADLPIADDDTRGVKLSSTSLRVDEGQSEAYTVRLTSQPTGTVTIDTSVSGSSDVAVDAASLSFNSGNWSAPQTVTVRAKQDADALDEVATVSHAVSGADYGANGVTADSVKVSVDDDEPLPVTVSFSSSAYEAEEGERATMVTVNLSAAPGRSVPISIVARGRGGASTDHYCPV